MSLLNTIDAFFAKNIKKRFISIASLPLLFTAFFLVDYFLLPEISKTDKVSEIYSIKISNSAGGTSVKSNHKAGYKYITYKNYKFSTPNTRIIKSPEINLTISPVFNTVKTVMSNGVRMDLASGFNGVNGIMMLLCNISIIISIIYVLLKSNVTENARQSLIFLNSFLLMIWGYILYLF